MLILNTIIVNGTSGDVSLHSNPFWSTERPIEPTNYLVLHFKYFE